MSYLYVALVLTWILFIGFGLLSVGTLRGAVEHDEYYLLLPKITGFLKSFLFLTSITWIFFLIVHLLLKLKERMRSNSNKIRK